MRPLHIIILAAVDGGGADYTNLTLPVRGKPAIAWVIEQFHDALDSVTIVLNSTSITAYQYIRCRYPEIRVCLVNEEEEMQKPGGWSILGSLAKGLSEINPDSSLVKVVLGDTICQEVTECKQDMLLVSKDFSTSERWCMVCADAQGNVDTFYDKDSDVDTSDKYAVVGYYQFSNPALLKSTLQKLITAGAVQMSDLLIAYSKKRPIACRITENWCDLGHKAGTIKAANQLFNSRDFNRLSSDPVHGTITKSSTKIEKLKDEFKWYASVPDEIKLLSPRPVRFEENDSFASLTMEMYGYPALSELFILGNLRFEEWELILQRLFEVHALFRKYPGELEKDNFAFLYLHKTWQRIKELRLQNPYWQDIWNYDEIIINHLPYRNIKSLELKLNEAIDQLVATTQTCVMHGDFCFSNILFDTNMFVCKLIDPRGRLGEQTIYGDSRYDIAKLRHSAVGGYDYVVHGLYRLREDGNSFTVTDNYPTFQKKLEIKFDELVEQHGYNLNEIKLIEALLFLSMIPLHKDSLNRQKLFYLKAVKKLNELFNN